MAFLKYANWAPPSTDERANCEKSHFQFSLPARSRFPFKPRFARLATADEIFVLNSETRHLVTKLISI